MKEKQNLNKMFKKYYKPEIWHFKNQVKKNMLKIKQIYLRKLKIQAIFKKQLIIKLIFNNKNYLINYKKEKIIIKI